ncbi:thiamine pyrophosphate-binding protein [Halegenticoccus soli]|uniref:thiamine pyrophosphate-binding protein n=1 Tax=Halegenticoccus soli TaxID=1985678 RepID=UPI000C6DC2F3|nr:thiamine pyrophosphate-binding protein [Halegenticoccus soli]
MTNDGDGSRGAGDGDGSTGADDSADPTGAGGSNTVERSGSAKRGSEYVYEALLDVGVEVLVGIPGTQTLPLDRSVVERGEMTYVMARHETAVPHVAWGYFEASGTPAATLTVPGPGDTNAMHGLKNAAEDNVPILHVSADVNPADRGKGPIHEIEPDTFDNVVKANVTVERPRDLPAAVSRGIETALTPPYGPVRLGVPSGILAAEFEAPDAEVSVGETRYDNAAAYEAAAAALASAERPVVYAGGGARRSDDGPRVVRELADALDAPVVTSYKGKGVFPEDDPRWLGVTGSHLPAGARRALAAADVVLALGTDFDGVTTDHWELPMGDALVHVNLNPDDVDASYESDVAVVADVTAAGDELLCRLAERDAPADRWNGASVASAVREEYVERLRGEGLFGGGAPANTPELLAAVRQATPREAVVTTDVGGFRLWSMQAFECYGRRRFVTAGSWAGMGVGLPAAIGAAIARPDRPVLCLSGDGGLMMCIHELHTAAEYDLDIVLVVSNNSDYGIISKSPKIREYTDDHEFTWESPSYAQIAEGFGWDAVRVETAADAGDAVAEAFERGGPTLVDVAVETTEPSAAEAAEYDSALTL